MGNTHTFWVSREFDYSPFGSVLVGRNWIVGIADQYRFGFNNNEKIDELLGVSNCIDFGARIYDSRIAKFFSIDPRSVEYAWQSTYAYFSNSPLSIVDIKGMGGDDPPTEKNFLITNSIKCDEQLNDTYQNNWVIIYAESVESASAQVSAYCKENNSIVGTVAFSHHGNNYFGNSWGKSAFDAYVSVREKIMSNNNGVKPEDYDQQMTSALMEYSESFSESSAKEFIALENFLSLIMDGGSYISAGCNEGGEGLTSSIAAFSGFGIDIYANTNASSIEFSLVYNDIKGAPTFGSILNISLSENTVLKFYDARGWEKFDSKTQTTIYTGKDLRLNSYGVAFNLTNTSDAAMRARMQYYDKTYRNWYKNTFGQEEYNNWLVKIKTTLGIK